MLIESTGLVIAAKVQPDGVTPYRVAWCDDHATLKAGDVVVMTEVSYQNVFIRPADSTTHSLIGDWGYVILSPIK